MPALPAIDDSNTYATKTEGGDPFTATDVISAADLNALKSRVSENRSQANTALADAETAQATADGALAQPGGTTTAGGIVIDVGGTGSAVAVSETTVTDLTTLISTAQTAAGGAQTDATQALSDAADALAAATGSVAVRLITTGATVTSSDQGKLLLVAVSGSDITLTFDDTCLATFACTVVRSYTSGTDPGGAVIFAGSSGTHSFAGAARLSSSQSMVRMMLAAIDGTTRYWQVEREAAHLYTPVQTAHTTSTKTLAAFESGTHTPLNTTSNSIAISIPDTLRVGWCATYRKSSASNSVTFTTGAGLITPTFYGQSTATANGTLISVFVEAAGVALVTIVEPA